ncbi:hypothetical protein [Nonomuraea sp. NPDC050202]|uniref:hypothetical protein n=1 Tax=Nonomuraea sp. NPDC050202 TaxID=3155035 RepID=UPI0033C81A4E
MEREWKEVVSRLHTSTELANVRLRGVPEKPIDGVSPDQADLIVPNGDDWFSIQAEIDRIRDSLAESEYIDVRTVGETAADLEERLSKAQTDLATTQALLSNTLAEVRETRARQVSLQRRITALEEDLQRHKDAALLRQLGSVHTSILNDSAICPTCQQQLVDGFEITDHPMTAEESIAHIQQELRTFKAMENDLFRHESAEQIKSRRLREDTAQLRRQIRSIKDALTSPSATPSVDRLTERLKEQERLEALIRIRDEVDSHMADLANRSIAWGNNQEALRALSGSQRTPQDSQKIQYLRRVFVDQLRAYHFGSIEPAHVEVSEETYRPTYEGFDLGFDLSASDMIRVIWAYLLGFLETGMAFNSNHPYLLMFDEPRQQETKEMSFQALLARAAADGAEGAQIIFATSWPEVPLEKMLAGLPHHLISERPDTKILRALASG